MRTHLYLCVGLVAACGGPTRTSTTTTTPPQSEEPPPDPSMDPRIARLEAELADAKDPIELATLHAELGSLLWELSCPDHVYGLCIQKTEVRNPPRSTCASYQLESVTSNVEASPRDPTHAAAAAEHFQAAIDLYDHGKLLGPRPADDGVTLTAGTRLAGFLGEVRLAMIDRDLEKAFELHFPTDLDFAKDQQGSMKRFELWFESIAAMLGKANTSYLQLAADETLATWASSVRIASAYRIGALNQWFADQLFRAPVPDDLQTDQELYEIYCDAMFDKAYPLEARALETFRACVVEANAAQVTGVWSEQCRHELYELDPSEAP